MSVLTAYHVYVIFVTIATNILEACDKLRDETLPSLGVRLEDKAGYHVSVLRGFVLCGVLQVGQ